MKVYQLEYRSPVGTLTLVSTERGLCYVGLPNSTGAAARTFVSRHFPGAAIKPGGKINREAARQLRAYFDGRLTRFSVPLDLQAPAFHKKVLGRVKAIGYGKTKTYGQIAASLGNPKSARAVGGANRSNPVPIIIPCHRVVAANGLGGYGGGVALKKTILAFEGAWPIGARRK